ncbi:MAG TPA: hypothetical protein VIY07_09565 [Pseudolabrys sp.]
MAMTNVQTSQLRYDASLIQRTAVEIARAAQFVLAGGGSPPPGDAMKANAKRAIADPVNESNKFMWYVVTDPQTQSNGSDPNATTDAQLQVIVSTTYPIVWA